jgi:ferrochelatase
MKTGVLLLNFGGPWFLSDVKPFLYRLFVNPRVLVGIPTPLRQLVAFLISLVKGPSSVRNYKSIGGGSPQLKWTAIQADGLQDLVNHDHIRVMMAMRTAEPSVKTVLDQFRFWGAEELVLLPLFPQFSTTTTAACFDAVHEVLDRSEWKPSVREINSWPDHPDYISLLRRSVNEAIAQAENERTASDPIHVLFSAHSLPMKIVNFGDPYPLEVQRTVQAVTRDLRHPWSLAFQSRNGRLSWLQPYLEDELKRLGREGIKRVVIVPISFVSDHIETLYELDQLYATLARENGITHYYRTRCFNDDPQFPRVLRSILREVTA